MNDLQKKKHEEKHGVGYYVAYRRDAKRFCCISAKHYENYGSEYERGKFFHEFKEAAEETDRLNSGENKENAPVTPTIIVSRQEDAPLDIVSNVSKKTVDLDINEETTSDKKRKVTFKKGE